MLNFDIAIELMKKYGYSSTSVHPYIYENGENIGICYSYVDEEFGLLERVKIFEKAKEFELFLQQLEFIRVNGKNYNVRMVLDNYESMMPKVIFLRNDKTMVEGEMFDIDNYDLKESQRANLDPISQVVYKAGDLLLVYDEIKGRQLQYLNNIVSLKNTLRTKYFELQKEIDIYNKYKVERNLNLLPEVHDIGINNTMEIAIKDKYNMYIVQRPSYEEAVDFLKEVWDLNKNLELNTKYYEAQKDENDTRNELKIVDEKLELMKKLNEDYRPLFGIDLVTRFRKINKKWNAINNTMSVSMIQENLDRISRKYAVYNNLNILSTSDYLREALQNTNYDDLVIKYSKDIEKRNVNSKRTPLNEVATNLSLLYRDKLDVTEQAIMVLYNNHKYRKLCNAILEVENFDTLPIKKLISKISKVKGFSKVKSECFDIVKKRIDDPVNVSIKNSLFKGYDFTSFETFISSLIKELVKLRNINDKMAINGNIIMYLSVKKVDDIKNKKFVVVTNDLNGLLVDSKENRNMIGIVLLKENTPVIYSPYYFDVGEIYAKNASSQMYIKKMVNFELLVDITDIKINIDPVKTNVVRYYSKPEIVDNISVVRDIMMDYKTTFCKYAFTSNIAIQPALTGTVQETPLPQVASSPEVSNNVVQSPDNWQGFDAGVNLNLEQSNSVEKNSSDEVEGLGVINPITMAQNVNVGSTAHMANEVVNNQTAPVDNANVINNDWSKEIPEVGNESAVSNNANGESINPAQLDINASDKVNNGPVLSNTSSEIQREDLNRPPKNLVKNSTQPVNNAVNTNVKNNGIKNVEIGKKVVNNVSVSNNNAENKKMPINGTLEKNKMVMNRPSSVRINTTKGPINPSNHTKSLPNQPVNKPVLLKPNKPTSSMTNLAANKPRPLNNDSNKVSNKPINLNSSGVNSNVNNVNIVRKPVVTQSNTVNTVNKNNGENGGKRIIVNKIGTSSHAGKVVSMKKPTVEVKLNSNPNDITPNSISLKQDESNRLRQANTTIQSSNPRTDVSNNENNGGIK